MQGTESVPELADQMSMDYGSAGGKNDPVQRVNTLYGQMSVQNSTQSQLQIIKNMTELTTGSVLTPIEDVKQ